LNEDLTKYPYVYPSKGRFTYHRDYPTKLRTIIGRKAFSYPLGDGQDKSQFMQKLTLASNTFEIEVKRATNSDPRAYKAAEISALVQKKLQSLRLVEGQIAREYPIDPELTALEQRNYEERGDQTPLQIMPDEVIDGGLLRDEWFEYANKKGAGIPLDINDVVFLETRAALLEVRKYKPKTLGTIWGPYALHRDTSATSTVWERYLTVVGHQLISPDSDDAYLNHSLVSYRDTRRASVKDSSIRRELTDIIACLRFTSREHSFGWRLQRPLLKVLPSKSKHVLTVEHQSLLVSHCLSIEDSTVGAAVTALLYLLGGVMFSEVERMDLDQQIEALNSKIPHVVISPKTKTKTAARPRAIPIIIGVDLMKRGIASAIRLNNLDKNVARRAVEKILVESTGTEAGFYVSYGLRHTLKANCDRNEVRDSDTCKLAGWTTHGGADNKIMLEYGGDFTASSDGMKSLLRSQKKALKHLKQFFG